MNAIILMAGSVTLLLGADAPRDNADVREVEQSLHTLKAAVARCDAVAMRRLFADGHVSITPYYGMMDRETHLKNVEGWKITEYKESDLKVTLLNRDTARVTYQFTIKGTFKGQKLPVKSRVVSIWVQRHGRWLESSYQETPIDGVSAPDDAATKEVVRLSHTLCQAFVTGDADTVKRLLADDHIAIFGHGRPETKIDQLRRLTELEIERADLQNVKATPIDRDVVAVSFKMARKGTWKGRELTPEAHGLAVWTKRDGRWQQVTYQETVPEK